jgi:OmpA-OmpF porin, OOP family
MKKVLYSLSALVLSACATTGDSPTMSAAELAECLQPNRRVVVDINGRTVKPPAKKPEAKPETAAKPAEAAPAAKAEAKPAKPQYVTFQQATYVQGNTAFDPGSAVLKEGGRKDLDQLVALLKKRAVQVGAIIISGHVDKLESESGKASLDEERAKAVKDYLASKGLDEKLMFWEGKDAREPVPVTKFCT